MDDHQLTPFDNMTHTRELQMLKTAIPYMKGNQKRQFAILVKYMELQNTAVLFSQEDKVLSMCSVEENESNLPGMLNALRPFCTSKELETLDMFVNVFSMLETWRDFT